VVLQDAEVVEETMAEVELGDGRVVGEAKVEGKIMDVDAEGRVVKEAVRKVKTVVVGEGKCKGGGEVFGLLSTTNTAMSTTILQGQELRPPKSMPPQTLLGYEAAMDQMGRGCKMTEAGYTWAFFAGPRLFDQRVCLI